MDKSNYNKKYIQFSDLRFNLNNSPSNTPVLVLDLALKQLCLFLNGEFFRINTTCHLDDFMTNGKIDSNILPDDLANKVWVLEQIDKKTKNSFILKGKKETYNQILSIENPLIGDVWLCNQNASEYIYTEENRWEQFGKHFGVQIEQLNKIYQQIDKIYSSISELQQTINAQIEKGILTSKLAIQSQTNRALVQQSNLKNLIENNTTAIKEELEKQSNRAKSVEQLLKLANEKNNKLISKQNEQLTSLKSILSTYQYNEEVSASITLLKNTVQSQSQALSELYTNMNIVQSNVDNKLQLMKQFINESNDNVAKLLAKAIQQNQNITSNKFNNLSTSLIMNVYNSLNKTQNNVYNALSASQNRVYNSLNTTQNRVYEALSASQNRVFDAISAAGYIDLSGISDIIKGFEDSLQSMSGIINENNKEERKKQILKEISNYDNQFESLNTSVNYIIDKIYDL